MKKEVCDICGKEITANNLVKHLLSHEEYRKKHPEYFYECRYCGRQFYRKESFVAHEKRCKLNPDRIDYNTGWSRGLTKETDERVLKHSITYAANQKLGKHKKCIYKHSKESKEKISIKLRGNHNNNVNKTGRGIKGWYKGFYCSSTYELAFIIYCLDHNIDIKRCDKYYTYEYAGKLHRYYPDFIINDIIYEIKGFHTELVDIKTASVTDKTIKVLYREDLLEIFDYIKTKYNKEVDINLQDLYEGHT